MHRHWFLILYLILYNTSSFSTQFQPLDQFTQKRDEIQEKIQQLKIKAEDDRGQTKPWQHFFTCAMIAEGMLNLANERLATNDADGAERALQHANEAIQRAEKHPHGRLHSGRYSLRFGQVRASSQSFVTGQSYEVSIPWIVEGEAIDQDYGFVYSLLDEYGREITSFKQDPKTKTSKWQAGTHNENVTFTVPSQLPLNSEGPTAMPKVFAGRHYLAVTVYSKEKDSGPTERNRLLLNNPEALRFFPVGRYYILKEIFITPHPVQITELSIPDMTVRESGNITIGMMNVGNIPLAEICAVRITTVSGTVAHEAVTNLTLNPNEKRIVRLSWEANFVGNMVLEVRLFQDDQFKTRATKSFTVRFLDEMLVGVARDQHALRDSGHIKTPILISMRGLIDASLDYYKISVWNESEKLTEVGGVISSDQNDVEHFVTVPPTWGYYFIRGTFSEGRRDFYYEKRIVGTVVETDSTNILVNGESFIIKGVNVHGLWPNSRTLSDRAMKIIKEYGFNTMRGDHPSLWLVELAHENNLCFMGLTNFSVTNSTDIYEHFEGDPLGGCQEITRQYILANRELPAMLFWNSANEVAGEPDELLVTLYPCFKVYDHYGRPVNYANLFEQDNWHGQDIMGINYYFDWGQRAASRQPIIERSIKAGLDHNLPVIYTEFNSWWGPVEESGEEAVWEIGQFGVDHGMSGGILYQLWDNRDSHPGLLDDESRLQVRRIMGDALKKYHADVEVGLLRRFREKVTLSIRNKRRCTLRKVRLELKVRGKNLDTKKLKDFQPEETRNVVVWLPRGLDKATVELSGRMYFETHFGLKNTVEVRMFVK